MKLFSDIVKMATNGEPGVKQNGAITRNRCIIAVVVILFTAGSFIISVYSLLFSYEQLEIQRAIYSEISLPNIHVQIDGASAWSKAVKGVNGDTVNYRIEVKNTGLTDLEYTTVKAILPSSLRYKNGSTKVYSSNSLDGVSVSDNIVTSPGLNIGEYGRGSNAWVYFSAEITVNKEQSDRNRILRSIVKVSGGDGIDASDMVDVAVEAAT